MGAMVLMPTPADAPLRKVTLNLYEDDVAIFEYHYGHGWSSYVRDLVNNHANLIRQSTIKTLGDLHAK